MTWFKFLLWIGGLYTAYYLVLIAWDNLRSGRKLKGEESNELTFSEDVSAVSLVPELSMADVSSPIYASGGVSLKGLFNLCRDEAVEYIKQVSY
jgi:hypothetical protein